MIYKIMELSSLAIRILLDSPVEISTKSLVYCYAHNINNIYMMTNILKKNNINTIFILDNKEKMSGVENGIKNKKIYENKGFNLVMIPYNYDIIHTKLESNILVDYAIENGYNHIIAVTPPFHTLRAVMTLVSSVIDKGLNNNKLKINSLAGITRDWSETSITHQGKTCTSGNNLIMIELERISKYMSKGDIRSASEIMDFFTRS